MFKHLVVTRFNANRDFKKVILKEGNSNWQMYRFLLMKNYYSTSLDIQKNKNFTPVIIVGTDTLKFILDYFNSKGYIVIISDDPPHLAFKDYMIKNKDIFSELIITRLDSDDCIDKNYINILQDYHKRYGFNYAYDPIKVLFYNIYKKKGSYKYFRKGSAFSSASTHIDSFDCTFFHNHSILFKKFETIKTNSLRSIANIHIRNKSSRVKGSALGQKQLKGFINYDEAYKKLQNDLDEYNLLNYK